MSKSLNTQPCLVLRVEWSDRHSRWAVHYELLGAGRWARGYLVADSNAKMDTQLIDRLRNAVRRELEAQLW